MTEHSRKKTRWEQKYEHLRDLVRQEIPGFTIRSKTESLWTRALWWFVNKVAWVLCRFKSPGMDTNHTTVCRTLWTGREWGTISWRNKWLILAHEYAFLQMIWFDNQRRPEQGRLRPYLEILFLLIFDREVRQHIMLDCWQTNMDYHVYSNEGKLNSHVESRIIRTLCGPEFGHTFDQDEATRAVNLMRASSEYLYITGRLDDKMQKLWGDD